MLISPDELAALEETLDVLASPELMAQLGQSGEAIASGDVLDTEELAELMEQRRIERR